MGTQILLKGSEILWKEPRAALILGFALFISALKCNGPG